MPASVYHDGVLRELWNDLATTLADGTASPVPARSVRFYTAAGAVASTRAYTTQENAAADAEVARAAATSNKAATVANITSDMATMQAALALQNAALTTDFNANPAKYLKDFARAIKRLDRVALGDFSAVD